MKKIIILIAIALAVLAVFSLFPNVVAETQGFTIKDERVSAEASYIVKEPEPVIVYVEKPMLSAAQVIWLARLMNCESGIKANAVNPNDLDNTPSWGILQFKDSTFCPLLGKVRYKRRIDGCRGTSSHSHGVVAQARRGEVAKPVPCLCGKVGPTAYCGKIRSPSSLRGGDLLSSCHGWWRIGYKSACALFLYTKRQKSSYKKRPVKQRSIGT